MGTVNSSSRSPSVNKNFSFTEKISKTVKGVFAGISVIRQETSAYVKLMFKKPKENRPSQATSKISNHPSPIMAGDVEELLFSSLNKDSSLQKIKSTFRENPTLPTQLQDLLENHPENLAGILLHFEGNPAIKDEIISSIEIGTPKQAGNTAIVAVELLKAEEAKQESAGTPMDDASAKSDHVASNIRQLMNKCTEGHNIEFMVSAIHGLYKAEKLNFGLINILIGELLFDSATDISDEKKGPTPSSFVKKTALGSEIGSVIDPYDVESVGKAARGITFGALLEDAIRRGDEKYSLVIKTYDQLIHAEIEKYNGEDDEKGCVNPHSLAFANKLAKITPQLLKELGDATTDEARKPILNNQGWRPQRTKPGLLPREKRPENFEDLTIRDFLFCHLGKALE